MDDKQVCELTSALYSRRGSECQNEFHIQYCLISLELNRRTFNFLIARRCGCRWSIVAAVQLLRKIPLTKASSGAKVTVTVLAHKTNKITYVS